MVAETPAEKEADSINTRPKQPNVTGLRSVKGILEHTHISHSRSSRLIVGHRRIESSEQLDASSVKQGMVKQSIVKYCKLCKL